MPALSVLLIDDKPRFLERVAAFLNQEDHLVVVGTTQSSRDGVEQAECLRPDVILLDWSMPERNGLELLPLLRTASPTSAVIMVTQHEDAPFRRAALEAGVAAFIPKRMLAESLVPAITKAASRV